MARNVIRVNRYYPSRRTTAYADFDRRTWVARLGMVDETQAEKVVGVTAEGLPATLRFSSKVTGALSAVDDNSLLGVRIDFQVGGAYTKAVLFHGAYKGGLDVYSGARSSPMPFGTKRQADVAVKVPDFSSFDVKLADHAPMGANGRVQITYVMQNSGPHTRAIITMVEAGSGGIDGGSVDAGATDAGLVDDGARDDSAAAGIADGSAGTTPPAMATAGTSGSGAAGVGAAGSSTDASTSHARDRSNGCACGVDGPFGPGGGGVTAGALALLLGRLRRRRRLVESTGHAARTIRRARAPRDESTA